jgi:hypothetical protein
MWCSPFECYYSTLSMRYATKSMSVSHGHKQCQEIVSEPGSGTISFSLSCDNPCYISTREARCYSIVMFGSSPNSRNAARISSAFC